MTYRTALKTEFVAIMLVHMTACGEDKINLRKTVLATLKIMNQELAPTLGADEQTLKGQSLFHNSLKAKIEGALKMK